MASPGTRERTVVQTWLRALELTAPIPKSPHRVLPVVVQEMAERSGEAPAILSAGESLNYRELAEQANRYSRWAIDHGLAKGDTVCLLMPNRPEYLAVWLGITLAGGVVALLNTNLVGPSLAHCIGIVRPRHLVVDPALVDRLKDVLPTGGDAPAVWVHGGNLDVQAYPGELLPPSDRPVVSVDDTALYIYTSGTTGLPKAARVSHFRLMQWSYWFAGLMDSGPCDRMYNCLPMYHSIGGVVAAGAMLVSGGSVVVREKFSAREFWDDIQRWDCSVFQYIGELCRYLLNADATPREHNHRIRMCCGNGLRPEIWQNFINRFRIPRVIEFYAATEGTFSLFNVEGQTGSIGRIPSFLKHRFPAALIKLDSATLEPVRDERGFCIRCAAGEVGEALGRITSDRAGRFEGYIGSEDSERKIFRNVFEPGDSWFRTGDLMRVDRKGFFYFVDRIGDTFRWKGENVSTLEVSEALGGFPGIEDVNVYGVSVPGADGRAGMAALVWRNEPDLKALHEHLRERLPAYARPVFLRLRKEMEATSTFKYTKSDLVAQGYDPDSTTDEIYFNDPQRAAFVRLDRILYDRMQGGHVRL